MQEVVPLIVSEGDLTPVLTVPNWDRVPWLEEHRAMLLNLEQRPSPRVFATHFHHHMMNESYFKTKPRVNPTEEVTHCALFNETHSDYCALHSVLQVLYVMRNPKDVFTSSYHYYGMASYLVNPGTQDQFMKKFLDGRSMDFRFNLHYIRANVDRSTKVRCATLSVPFHGNFELRPLGVAMGNAFSMTRV